MALRAVVFDVGETLVDETHDWEHAADACGVPRFTLMALVGAAIERGEPHFHAFDLLGVGPPASAFFHDVLYPDALPCLQALRGRGLVVGAAGNMAIGHEDLVRPHVDFVASSDRWGVQKPAAEFFARIAAETELPPAEIAYVGDRLDNDVLPAKRAGMTAVLVRRGPWGHIHSRRPEAAEADLRIDSLLELPELL